MYHSVSTQPGSGNQARHQAALDAGHFLIKRCGGCSRHVYFPRELCPHCGSAELELVAPAGTGTVYAARTVRRKAEAGGDFNISLVDLDEGVRLMSRVEGPTDTVRIGQRVRARVQRTTGQPAVVVFDRVQED
ncbi:Zn-ribbon domain-containing OB-fold protein [Pseudorhodoferax sp. Leaf267]|uniref:Zn-ribbon domain-containing OB-fold protein n=1 Tax=Pseudorhodoferax sp. Leaf267 TaxID=1736316 RepID=UPI0006FF7D8A|nr:OB-fold domain-containing protein [Pseudorhodoferax sp. Leaf267]KQP14181.1 DNA-binding protein [Pseudorhodoferax sp. Leaf267]